ncbi:hypothetical protein A3842_11175 [Paenibacillus sp. P3E]|uniref:hypothetical protein n=1 Tax=Paenibacillus sp. P3E TaxID=1349435 RepID=UPI00093D4D51|nr:hypothetical protein [Paenibacillus sp. P3E]OKP81632.1 hypothetical protein A3842_11175 [Paenibacillus sp. P3E]
MQTIALLVVIFLLLCAVGYLLRVNGRLTDKVMAKDYREYKTLDKPVDTVETPKRKPMSWADDVDYDDDNLQ